MGFETMAYAIGLDFGTNSVRCLLVDAANGDELGTAVYGYETGQKGIILDAADHNLARQNPGELPHGTRKETPWQRLKSWILWTLPWFESSKGLGVAYAKAKVARENNTAEEIAARKDFEGELRRVLDQREIKEFNANVDDILSEDGLSSGGKMLKLAKLVEKNQGVLEELAKTKEIAIELGLKTCLNDQILLESANNLSLSAKKSQKNNGQSNEKEGLSVLGDSIIRRSK